MVTEDKYVESVKTVDTGMRKERPTRREVDEKEIQQLSELVDLAETVSANIDRLTLLRAFCYVGAFVISTLLIYFILTSPSVLIKYIYLILPAVISILGMLHSGVKTNEKIKLESLILRDLLNTIHPFKESVFRNTGEHIHKAIFRMKLSRISFSNIEDPKPTRQKEQPIPQPKEPATTP